MEIETALAEYLATTQQLERETQRLYKQQLGVFAHWASEQGLMLESLKAVHIVCFIAHLQATHHPSRKNHDQLSDRTLAGYVRNVKTFLTWCADDEEFSACISFATVRKIKMPRKEEKIIEPFSDAQLESLRLVCRQEYSAHMRLRSECILALLQCTGLRAAELCRLTIENTHLHPKEAYIKIFGKGRKWREVPFIRFAPLDDHNRYQLDHKARRLLDRYRREYRSQAAPTDVLFIGRTGDPMTVDSLGDVIEKMGKRAQIEGVRCSPHTFRHTFAHNFMRTIGDVYLLSKLLGHASVAITEQYLKSFSSRDVRLSLVRRMSQL